MNRPLIFIAWALPAIVALAWVFGFFDSADYAQSQRSLDRPSAFTDGRLTRPAPVEPPPVEPPVAPVTSAERFKLVGVVSPGSMSRTTAVAAQGIALIAVDGKPARAFRVGATVEGDTVVREVSASGAVLGPRAGGEAIALQVSSPAVPPIALAPAMESTPQVPVEQLPSPEKMQGVSKYPPLQRPAESTTEDSAVVHDKTADGSWTR
jgi:general secretion pathway protein C